VLVARLNAAVDIGTERSERKVRRMVGAMASATDRNEVSFRVDEWTFTMPGLAAPMIRLMLWKSRLIR
jgi:sigma54-dependent transcription regulator